MEQYSAHIGENAYTQVIRGRKRKLLDFFSVDSLDPKFQALSKDFPKYYLETALNFFVEMRERKKSSHRLGVCLCDALTLFYVSPKTFGLISYAWMISLA